MAAKNNRSETRTRQETKDALLEYRARQLGKLATTPEEAQAATEAVYRRSEDLNDDMPGARNPGWHEGDYDHPNTAEQETTMTETTQTIPTETLSRMASEIEAQMKTEDNLTTVAANKALAEATPKTTKAKKPIQSLESFKAKKAEIVEKRKAAKAQPAPTPEPVVKGKTTTKPPPSSTPKPEQPKKDGLRKPQIAVLKLLSSASKPLTRKEIAQQTKTDLASLTGVIGPMDPVKRKYNDETYFVSLITLGYVRGEQHDEGGKDVVVYTATAAGKKAAAKL